MKQKVLALSLAFCMALSLSPVGVLAKQTPAKTGGDISVSQGSEGTPAQGDPASSTPASSTSASSDPASSTPATQAAPAGAPAAPATKVISAFAEPAIIEIEIGDTRTEGEIIASFPSAVLATVDGAENAAVPVSAWTRVFPSADTAYASDAQGEFFYEPSIDNSVYTLSPEATLPSQTVQVGAALSHAPQLANTLSGLTVGAGGSETNLTYGQYYPVANGALSTAQDAAPASGGYLRLEGTTLYLHDAVLSGARSHIIVPIALPNLTVELSGTNSLSGEFLANSINLRVTAAEENASFAVEGMTAGTYTQDSGSVNLQKAGETALSTTGITLNGGTLTASGSRAFSVAPTFAVGASFAIAAGADEAGAREVDPVTHPDYFSSPYVKIAPLASTYDVWVADVQVTSANQNNVLAGLGLTGAVSFDPTTNTLTLNGVNIENASYTNGFIHTTLETLNIKPEGENTVRANATSLISGKNLHLTGAESATLNLVNTAEGGHGLYAEGNFTQDGGTLTATGGMGGTGVTGGTGGHGLYAEGNFTQDGGTLTATGGAGGAGITGGTGGTGGTGIYAERGFTQSGGTLTATGGGGGGASGEGGEGGEGIYAERGFTQSGGTLTATGGMGGTGVTGGTGGHGLYAEGNFTQDGGTLTATGGNGATGGTSVTGGDGIHAVGDFTQTGGALTATGGNGGTGATDAEGGSGVVSGGFTQTGGTLTATGGDDGAYGRNGLALNVTLVSVPDTIFAGESAENSSAVTLAEIIQVGSGFFKTKGYRYVKMQDGGNNPVPVGVKVSVGGQTLTPGIVYNPGNLPGLESGSVSVTPSGTIILEDAIINTFVESEGGINLELNGSNTFAPTGGGIAIESDTFVTIEGGANGTLLVAGGIQVGNNMTISGVNLVVEGQTQAGNNIQIQNANFTATSEGTSVNAENVSINGGSLEAVSSGGAPAVFGSVSTVGAAQVFFQNSQANRAVFSHGVQKTQDLPLASAVQGRVFREAPSASASVAVNELQSIDHQNSAYLRVETSYFKLAETPVQEGASLTGAPLTDSELAPVQTWAQGRGGRVLLAQNLLHSDENANALTPSAPVPLQMQVVGVNAGETLVGLHVTNSGEIQQIPITVQSTQEGITQASMNAATFSIYAVVALPSESARTSGAGATTMLSPQTGAA